LALHDAALPLPEVSVEPADWAEYPHHLRAFDITACLLEGTDPGDPGSATSAGSSSTGPPARF
jgi:hypothetical protein